MSGGQRYSAHLLISMLAKTYGGFIEGFNAPKLKSTEELLDELPYKPPASQKLRLNKLQHEAIALIANLDHAEIPRVVGPAEHFPFFG